MRAVEVEMGEGIGGETEAEPEGGGTHGGKVGSWRGDGDVI